MMSQRQTRACWDSSPKATGCGSGSIPSACEKVSFVRSGSDMGLILVAAPTWGSAPVRPSPIPSTADPLSPRPGLLRADPRGDAAYEGKGGGSGRGARGRSSA